MLKLKIKSGHAPLSPLERARLELSLDYLFNYKLLTKNRMDCFDDHGQITIRMENGTSYKKHGGTFIRDVITFFEKKDEVTFYQMCADLKKVLDEYNLKFA